MSAFNGSQINCTVAPESAASDSGVAGAGILLAFIITAFLALSISTFIILSELRGTRAQHAIPRQILSGLSDQQLVEGIAIQIVGLVSIDTMISYHFFIIWTLALLSTATNFACLLALVQDFKRDWVLRWLRQFAMFVNLGLTVVFGVLVLQTNLKNLALTLPVRCVWQDHAAREVGDKESSLSVIGTVVVIAASSIIFVLGTWYLHMKKQRWGAIMRCVSLLVLVAIAVGATVRVLLISQAFGTPSVHLADQGEKAWSFGQLLTMLLLILPFVSALEMFRGQLHVPKNKEADLDADQIPLTAGPDSSGFKGGNASYAYQASSSFR